MGSGSVLPVVAIQLAGFLAPLAAGLAGWISGATAGFASVTVWFAVALPLSYACADRRRERRCRAAGDLPVSVPALSPPSRA
jgi:hypothetical protein